MQIKSKFAFVLLLTFFALKVKAQSDNIELSDKQNILINRLDIKLRGDSVMQFTTVKPYNRARITARIEKIDSLYKAGILGTKLSKVDEYNIRSLLMNNSDWTTHYIDS
ncbi:MAG TPA: hypothetical protein VFQ86_03695, partial [Arachidicoccus soli]|nr:hypothetical protein [Arachidicoccus soli]